MLFRSMPQVLNPITKNIGLQIATINIWNGKNAGRKENENVLPIGYESALDKQILEKHETNRDVIHSLNYIDIENATGCPTNNGYFKDSDLRNLMNKT